VLFISKLIKKKIAQRNKENYQEKGVKQLRLGKISSKLLLKSVRLKKELA